jgi:hypothetical protein
MSARRSSPEGVAVARGAVDQLHRNMADWFRLGAETIAHYLCNILERNGQCR